MKNLIVILTVLLLFASCSTPRQSEKQESSTKLPAPETPELSVADSLRHYPTQAIQRAFFAELARKNGDLHRALYEYQEAVKFDSKSAFLYEQIGELYLMLQNLDEALAAYLKATAIVPDNAHYLRVIAELSHLTGYEDQAIIYWEKALQIQPDNIENYIVMADYLAETGQYYEAIDKLNTALQLDPENEEILTKLFDYSQDINDYQQALQILEKLTILFPEEKRYRNTLMKMFFVQELDEIKMKMMENWLQREPDNFELRLLYTGLLMDNAYYSLASEQVEKLMPRWQENTWISLWRAQLAEMTDDDDEIIFYYERSVQDTGAPIQAFQNYVIWLFKKDKYEDAIRILSKARERFPDELPLLQMTALVYNYIGNSQEAIYYYEKIIQIMPDNRELKHTLAILYEQAKQYEKSDAIYDDLIKSQPKDEMALNNYSYSLAIRGIQLDLALDYVSQALEIDPQNGAYYDTKAWIYFRIGNYQKALEYVEKAIELDGNSSEIYFHRGEILLALENLAAAKEAFQKAVEITPDYAEAIKRLEELP
ncbi:MAG TPA: tetratricopeptide repeat protein [Candidatus Marinimicrobia bacterium]|nr:tetratricopeptide repeat protein [Candidatus Neomarinimicrobiota bacterium]